MGAPILAQVRDLLEKGRFLDAATKLSSAARNGDRVATAELAQWSIAGQIVPRDLPRARFLRRRQTPAMATQVSSMLRFWRAAPAVP
jgi:hypothetical protein